MNHYFQKFILLGFLGFACFFSAKAQSEYLVRVNPASGNYSRINRLPGVNWITIQPKYTAFDEINQRFIFKGADSLYNSFLYSIDANTGTILSNPSFPVLDDPADNIIELQYDDSANVLYGLHWDNSENREYFVSINPSTGTHTLIDNLPGVNYIQIGPTCTTFDKNNHRYFFKGIDFEGFSHIYTINATTGQILSSPTFPNSLLEDASNFQYDNSLGKLFGMHKEYSDSLQYLVSIDPATGVYALLHSLPATEGIIDAPHYVSYNEVDHHFYFLGITPSPDSQSRLFTIDVTTGACLSSPIFPVLSQPFENVVELHFDNSSSTLYALHWGADKITSNINDKVNSPYFNLSPNPFTGYSILSLNKEYHNVVIFIYNSEGQQIRKEEFSNTSSITLKKENLSSGAYYISVICDHNQIGIQKIIIQ